jgi:hypothetical protein
MANFVSNMTARRETDMGYYEYDEAGQNGYYGQMPVSLGKVGDMHLMYQPQQPEMREGWSPTYGAYWANPGTTIVEPPNSLEWEAEAATLRDRQTEWQRPDMWDVAEEVVRVRSYHAGLRREIDSMFLEDKLKLHPVDNLPKYGWEDVPFWFAWVMWTLFLLLPSGLGAALGQVMFSTSIMFTVCLTVFDAMLMGLIATIYTRARRARKQAVKEERIEEDQDVVEGIPVVQARAEIELGYHD